MSRFVLDSSVALKSVFQEPDSDQALKLREDFRQGLHEFIAPDIFMIEVGHVLTKAHRQRKITEQEAQDYLADIRIACPSLTSSLAVFSRGFQLSLASRTALYDCLCVATSEVEQCELITADQKLVANFLGHAIIDLASC